MVQDSYDHFAKLRMISDMHGMAFPTCKIEESWNKLDLNKHKPRQQKKEKPRKIELRCLMIHEPGVKMVVMEMRFGFIVCLSIRGKQNYRLK